MNSFEKGHDMGSTTFTFASAVDNLILTHRGQLVENKGIAHDTNRRVKKLETIK